MKPLTLYPHEIRRLADAGTVTVWRPIKPQPPAYINDLHGGELSKRAPYTLEDNETGIIIGMGFFDDDDMPYICPHPPGSERWVREVWRRPDCNPDTPLKEGQLVQYKAAWKWHDGFGDPWRSPVTMPRWASRLSVTVAGVEARQVQGVTEQEARDAGLADLTAFAEWWQRRFDTLGPNPWAWATKMEVKQ